jgi:hypothetical protein
VPAELIQNMAAALHSPSAAAELIQAVVTSNPQAAAATAKTAIQVAPSFAALLTAAAIHSAPQQTAHIVSAMVSVAPKLTQKIQTSANVASALKAQPDQSVTIIGAEVVSQPALAATIITASVTICDLLHACPHTSVETLVRAAIAVDREVTEEVVGAAVYLVPSQAGAIIAAADEALANSAQPEDQRASAAADAISIEPGEYRAQPLQPVGAEPSMLSSVIAPQAAASGLPRLTVVTRVRALEPPPDASGYQQTSKSRAAPVAMAQAQDSFDPLLRVTALADPTLTSTIGPVQWQGPDQQSDPDLLPRLDRRQRARQPAPRPHPASPHF